MTGRYAEGTTVSAEKSRVEIETILRRYGASEFASGWDTTRVALMFTAHDRRVRFDMPMPSIEEIPAVDGHGRRLLPAKRMERLAAEERRRWRALALAIKAKLEVVQSGIAEFEAEFLAHIVMPDGRTVGDHVRPAIQETYEKGVIRPLLALGAGGDE